LSSSSQSFQLGTPPRRTTQPLRRQAGTAVNQTGAGLGLGLRRTVSGAIATVDEDSVHMDR
jgi:hypothetical protein